MLLFGVGVLKDVGGVFDGLVVGDLLVLMGSDIGEWVVGGLVVLVGSGNGLVKRDGGCGDGAVGWRTGKVKVEAGCGGAIWVECR
jgi:hypothetical protein